MQGTSENTESSRSNPVIYFNHAATTALVASFGIAIASGAAIWIVLLIAGVSMMNVALTALVAKSI